jgi:hypothetical protein
MLADLKASLGPRGAPVSKVKDGLVSQGRDPGVELLEGGPDAFYD